MRVLVLGGTQFLSRVTAAEAVRRGHDVTCANRGRSGTVPPGVTTIRWDRAESAPRELLDAEPYDAVVDVSRIPSHVRRAVETLGEHSPDAHWVFVSTVSVYADDSDPAGPGRGQLRPEIVEDLNPMADVANYGGMKIACERIVLNSSPAASVVRPGLIVGPGDPGGRFAYWARRSTTTERTLAPGRPTDDVQVIDVRDLAAWIVTLAERRTTGTYDAVGPIQPLGDLLQQALPDAELVWVDQDFLEAQKVEPWAGPESIPLWLPRPAYDGMLAHDPSPALAAGLEPRPIAATTRDTRAWLEADPAARITGITLEREAELLALWDAH